MPQPDPLSSAEGDDSPVVRFTDMAYGGDAVGRLGDGPGVAVFAWPGIEGGLARVAVTERRKNLLRGAVTEVLEPSPLRVEPPCPYFGPCGGCQWQHVGYAGQVKFKHDILRSQLERIGGIEAPDLVLKDPIESPRQFGYRNTSHFALDTAAPSLGYLQRDSHTVVPVDRCPISNDGINEAIPIVNSLLAQAPGEDFVREQTHGVMRVWQVTIRSGQATGHTLVAFHTARPESRRGSGRGDKLRS